jgi:hypothetical protein
MNYADCAPQTCISAPGGRHRYSEALPGHDAAAVASPPPVARHRSGSADTPALCPEAFPAGRRLGQSANPPGLAPYLLAASVAIWTFVVG